MTFNLLQPQQPQHPQELQQPDFQNDTLENFQYQQNLLAAFRSQQLIIQQQQLQINALHKQFPPLQQQQKVTTPASLGLQKSEMSSAQPRSKNAQSPWSSEEDALLLELVKRSGAGTWTEISQQLNAQIYQQEVRTAAQCNQRYSRVLNEEFRKGAWTLEEDSRLLDAIKHCQPQKWQQIARTIGGRSDVQVRYRVKKLRHWLLRQGVPVNYV